MGSNTSHSDIPYNSQCVAKYLTAPLNEQLCWFLCDPQKRIHHLTAPKPLQQHKKSNKLPYLSYL